MNGPFPKETYATDERLRNKSKMLKKSNEFIFLKEWGHTKRRWRNIGYNEKYIELLLRDLACLICMSTHFSFYFITHGNIAF